MNSQEDNDSEYGFVRTDVVKFRQSNGFIGESDTTKKIPDQRRNTSDARSIQGSEFPEHSQHDYAPMTQPIIDDDGYSQPEPIPKLQARELKVNNWAQDNDSQVKNNNSQLVLQQDAIQNRHEEQNFQFQTNTNSKVNSRDQEVRRKQEEQEQWRKANESIPQQVHQSQVALEGWDQKQQPSYNQEINIDRQRIQQEEQRRQQEQLLYEQQQRQNQQMQQQQEQRLRQQEQERYEQQQRQNQQMRQPMVPFVIVQQKHGYVKHYDDDDEYRHRHHNMGGPIIVLPFVQGGGYHQHSDYDNQSRQGGGTTVVSNLSTYCCLGMYSTNDSCCHWICDSWIYFITCPCKVMSYLFQYLWRICLRGPCTNVCPSIADCCTSTWSLVASNLGRCFDSIRSCVTGNCLNYCSCCNSNCIGFCDPCVCDCGSVDGMFSTFKSLWDNYLKRCCTFMGQLFAVIGVLCADLYVIFGECMGACCSGLGDICSVISSGLGDCLSAIGTWICQLADQIGPCMGAICDCVCNLREVLDIC